LSLGEQGSLHVGQGSPLEGLDGALYPVEGIQVTLQGIGPSSIGEGGALVIFEDDADTGHEGFVSFYWPPSV
jgi:hypothetical protein